MHCTAYLILGSNMGDRLENLTSASSLLSANDLTIVQQSQIYESEAWGKTDQENFLNQALEISTTLSPTDLLKRCNKIEDKLGRIRQEKWGPRMIDIDIAYYENLIIQVDELSIPQRDLENRKFALTVLSELSKDKQHPLLMRSNKELLQDCPDLLNVHLANV